MLNPHIVRKNTSPTTPPPEAGVHWINLITNEEYFSVGTSSTSDWIKRVGAPKRMEVVISQPMLDNKKISLPYSHPSPELVALTFINGIEQLNGTDFSVVGADVVWDGLGLDGFIELGDIVVIYF